MQALRLVMLLVSVAIVYLLFFHSAAPLQSPTSADTAEARELAKPLISPSALPPGMRARTAVPQGKDQYKQAIDRARAVGRQMQDERVEADSM